MPNWDEIARNAANETDDQFAAKISSLTSLKDDEIKQLLLESGISRQDLTELFKIINDATLSNQQKAQALRNINHGIEAASKIIAKFL